VPPLDLTRFRALATDLSEMQLIRDCMDLLQDLLNGKLDAANVKALTVSPAVHGATHEQGAADPVASLPTAAQKLALAGTSGTPGSGNKYVTDGDSRNTNSRVPTAHATTHQPGGTDAMAADAAAGTASLRSLGATSVKACAGNDSRLSDSRTPTAHATTHQNGGSDVIGLASVVAPTFSSANWTNYGGGYRNAGYYKDSFGIVHLEGLCVAAAGASVSIFTLPTDYRPSSNVIIAVITTLTGGTSTVANFISINTGGVVSFGTISTLGGNWHSLDGATFRAA
jgi:hypothetical protein